MTGRWRPVVGRVADPWQFPDPDPVLLGLVTSQARGR